MKKISAALLCILLLTAAAAGEPLSQYQQQSSDGERTIEKGRVTSLDWVEGIITIEWMQYAPVIKHDNITLSVPRDIRISKDGSTIGFSELEQFDTATITYRRDSPVGLPKVVRMSLITHGY